MPSCSLAARTDASAFRELYERYAERIYGYHLRRAHDAHAAHDLTAETFAQAWLSRARFRDEARRLGRAVAVRDRPSRAARQRAPAAARVQCLRAPRRARRALGREPAAANPDDGWLEGLDEALAHLPEAQQRGDPPARRRGPRLRRGRRAARRPRPQAVRARVSRGLSTLRKHLSDPMEMTR